MEKHCVMFKVYFLLRNGRLLTDPTSISERKTISHGGFETITVAMVDVAALRWMGSIQAYGQGLINENR